MVTLRKGSAGKILNAARQIVLEQGLAALRVDAVAALAGVNKRMIYHHFGAKEGLSQALYAWQMAILQAAPDALSEESTSVLRHLVHVRFGPLTAVHQQAWMVTNDVPAAEEVCCALQLLLPRLIASTAEGRLPQQISTQGFAHFALEATGLLFPELGRTALQAEPGAEKYAIACKRLLTRAEAKPVYRLHSQSRPLPDSSVE